MIDENELKKKLLKQLINEMELLDVEEEVVTEEEALPESLDDLLGEELEEMEECDEEMEDEEDDGVIRIGASQALQSIKTPEKTIVKKSPIKITKKG
jgi:hypothetical protein